MDDITVSYTLRKNGKRLVVIEHYKGEVEERNNNKVVDTVYNLYRKNDSIYEGEFFLDEKNNQFNYAGDGILITSNKEFIQIKNQPKDCE